MCSDDQLWLIQAVYRYFRLSGDTGFLRKEFRMAGSGETRPLYRAMERIVEYSGRISVGKHGLPLLDKADWNDCLRLDKEVLDDPEKEKRYREQLEEKGQAFGVPFENSQSESVMNACLLKIAADELAEMADALGEAETAEKARETAATVAEAVNRDAWIEDYYARCLINDGREYSYLGPTGDSLSLDETIDGTYYLNSFSWALLADIASEDRIRRMLDIVDRYLRTDSGLKLVTPVDYDKLGIVTGSSFYFPGDRENGGVFKHAAMMCTVACLRKAKTVQDTALAERLKELAFFDDISAACKDKTNVIYEICNEPNGVEWSRIREYAETIIPIIRNNDPDSVIIVGTPDWSQRVDIAADDPLGYPNLLYALHFYSATHKQELRDKVQYAIDKKLPVFVTEYGVTASTGNFPYDMEEADVWIDFLEENGISHVMWNFSKVSESSAAIKASVLEVSGFEYDDFSKSGQWLIDMISSRSGASK